MISERKWKIDIDEFKFDLESLKLAPEKIFTTFKNYIEIQQLYSSAIREISTKLENLNAEFLVKYEHNPIHHMEYRVKQLQSIINKLTNLGLEANIELATKHLTDIAGIRVICYYIDDVYKVAELLLKQDDITLIKKSDYIQNPKESGYRSLHIVISVPVFLSSETKRVPVEVQIRTIAMDFWASLEHELNYKSDSEVKDDLQKELTECAQNIANIDSKMQNIYGKIKSQRKISNE